MISRIQLFGGWLIYIPKLSHRLSMGMNAKPSWLKKPCRDPPHSIIRNTIACRNDCSYILGPFSLLLTTDCMTHLFGTPTESSLPQRVSSNHR